MKKLKFLIVVSVLNIGMFHFNISWSDFFKPINAYDKTGSLVGDILGRVIIDQIGDKLDDAILKRSLSLQNKQTGEVIRFSPGTIVRINLEDTDYTFKRYKIEENIIYLKAGSLDFTYDFSTLDYISVVLEPKITAGAVGATILGGAVGFGLGMAAETASNPEYMSTGGGAMMGCTLGMFAGPIYTNLQERETIDFSLTDWEVH
tara:strand:- start:762 stop:1373 length:612 start_codon:yes stop_codon:yes gene_type:complete